MRMAISRGGGNKCLQNSSDGFVVIVVVGEVVHNEQTNQKET
jgi:hypothetical protein